MDRELRAAVIARAQKAREALDDVLELLLPESPGAACSHPPALVTDESTMGAPLFTCRGCGVSQSTPFPSQE